MSAKKIMSKVICVAALALSSASSMAVDINAALNWPGDKAQFFLNDGSYVRFDLRSWRADPGYPKRVDDRNWPGLGAYGRMIVASFRSYEPSKAYFFFANGEYARYDINADKVDPGYPKRIDDRTWPGMGRHAGKIYGAMNWPGDKVQFFLSDGTYVRYDLRADRVDQGYPKRVDHKTWPGLGRYAGDISGAFTVGGKAFFFLETGDFLRYDIASDRVDQGYPRRIDDASFPGVARGFRRHGHHGQGYGDNR